MSSSLIDEKRLRVAEMIRAGQSIIVIAHQVDIIERQMQKMRQNLLLYDFVVRSSMTRDRSRALNDVIENRLLKYIDLHLTVYLNEITLFIYDEFEIEISISIVSRFLDRVS